MAITLNLSPEVEDGLFRQANAAGLSLDQFLSRELEALAPCAPMVSIETETSLDTLNLWAAALDEWLDSFPQQPVLSEDALTRDSWYPDRW